MSPSARFAKRSFDLTVSFIGLIVLAPAMAVVALLVKITSPGPAFYRQQRVGRRGRLFTCIKFRTMSAGADSHGSITSARDTRVTALGRVLRRLKLDELPQLCNVLVGRMSFVGPRPDVPGYADRLEGPSRRMLELRPGITGPATLYFRYEEAILGDVDNPKEFNDSVIWPAKVALNLDYLDHWSFCKDIGYILVTLFPGLNSRLRLVPRPPRSAREMVPGLRPGAPGVPG